MDAVDVFNNLEYKCEINKNPIQLELLKVLGEAMDAVGAGWWKELPSVFQHSFSTQYYTQTQFSVLDDIEALGNLLFPCLLTKIVKTVLHSFVTL